MNYAGKLFYLVILLFVNSTIAQVNTSITDEKVFSSEYQILAGECILKNSKLSVDSEISMKTFEIEVLKDGEYYLSAWVMNTGITEKNNGLKFFVDEQKNPSGTIKPQKEGWQSSILLNNDISKTEKLTLTAGKHLLTFCSTVPDVPMVEFIRISKTEQEANISSKEYDDYIEKLKAETAPKVDKSSIVDSTALSLRKELENPLGNYEHRIDQKFGYCYYNYFYFYAGALVTFETKRDNPYASDPVMQLFNYTDPINKGSWTNDDGGQGTQSKISVTVQYTGYYMLYIRNYRAGQAGTSDLYLYDNLYASDVCFNNYYGIRCDHSLTETLNYFTCNAESGGDTRLWIEDQTGFPGLIIDQNDDYYGDGDYYWGYHSRIKKAFNRSIRSGQVTAYSSYAPIKYCDFYLKCRNSTIMSYFPSLEPDDAIMASNTNNNQYNCISWSGGRVDLGRYFWPPDYGNPWHDSNGALASFDNFYNNKDENGFDLCRGESQENGSVLNKAMDFIRSGATENNSCVALWASGGSYTHGSVNSKYTIHSGDLPANEHPHGYDWESKPGGLMRTFHPRDALEGSSYGSISKWYRWDGTWTYGTPPQNQLAKSSSAILVTASFSESEDKKMDSFIDQIPDRIRNSFNEKYIEWKKTWEKPELQLASNPRVFTQSNEYDNFINYCKSIGKSAWLLLIDNFANGDELCTNAIADLTFNDYPKLMNQIVGDGNNYARENDLIPSQSANWTNYCKRILDTLEESDMHGAIPEKDENHYGYDESAPDEIYLNQNAPNPFNMSTTIRFGLPEQKSVSLVIYNVVGQEVAILIDKDLKSAGWHTVKWNGLDKFGNSVSTGLYFYKLIIGNRVLSKKLLVIK